MIRYYSYRQIKFGGKWSLEDFGVLIGQGTDTNTAVELAKPRILRETVPFMDGSYDYSRMSGKLVYDDRTLRYTFIISGHTRADVEEKARQLDNWLGEVTDTELYDTDYSHWKFTGVAYMGMGDLTFYSSNENKAQITAEFTAAPYMRSLSGKLIDCVNFTPNSDTTAYLFAEHTSSYVLTRLKSFGSSGFSSLTVTFETPAPQSGIHYAVAEMPTANAPKWYLMPKKMSGMTVTMEDPQGCVAIKEDVSYYYLYQEADTTVSVQIWGLDYDSYTEVQLESIIKHSSWMVSDDVQSFAKNSVPSTSSMRIISEGEPSLTINGVAANIAGFPLVVGDELIVSGVKSEPSKLQYCTAKERR